jgi:hypothetical protein
MPSVELLLKAGADLGAKAVDGRTPLDCVPDSETRVKVLAMANDIRPAVADEPMEEKIKESARADAPEAADAAPVFATREFTDGSAYQGEWRSGHMHGTGVLTFASGELYRGNWIDGQQHGRGTYTFPDGESYDGDWRNGRMWGHGVYTFADGSVLEGEWRDNQLELGSGTYVFPDGDRYRGEWRANRMWGRGEYVTAQNVRLSGYWRRNAFNGDRGP